MESSSKRKAKEPADSTSTTKRQRVEELIQNTNKELEAQIASEEAQVAKKEAKIANMKENKKQITDLLSTFLGDDVEDRMGPNNINPRQNVIDDPARSHGTAAAGTPPASSIPVAPVVATAQGTKKRRPLGRAWRLSSPESSLSLSDDE
ncbi:2-haloalkanoic acid dehalogenase [Lasiodiplodia theobromae]|uniref:2-haloalkanoic acid dehalogenase n=1 Tax=Lasiodiplodia theobromae TaxID=45133 RepID=UPI0015C3A113|nr:2-haloalkanoic acid dehalogenase [Lasiodiplodia theobromae]KAF4538680.1 2-haloalkanoic acid dehalogenase [Lasiodiplodia theobromae]